MMVPKILEVSLTTGDGQQILSVVSAIATSKVDNDGLLGALQAWRLSCRHMLHTDLPFKLLLKSSKRARKRRGRARSSQTAAVYVQQVVVDSVDPTPDVLDEMATATSEARA